MTEATIRRATPEDAERLAAVYRSAYAENRELGFPAKAESATAAEVREWIESATVLVAAVEGTVVGGVRLERTDGDRAKLSRLGVHEDWKGEGLGGRLVDATEARARDRGAAVLRLTTPGEHPYLPAFYRRRGYERTGTYPLEYREYDEIVLEKPLG